MKIEYTKEDANFIERSYRDMVYNMKHPPKGKPCSDRVVKYVEWAMFHTLSICGVKFTALGNGGAFRVFAPDGNDFPKDAKESGGAV